MFHAKRSFSRKQFHAGFFFKLSLHFTGKAGGCRLLGSCHDLYLPGCTHVRNIWMLGLILQILETQQKNDIVISGLDVILLLYLSTSNLPSCFVSKFVLPLVFEVLEMFACMLLVESMFLRSM